MSTMSDRDVIAWARSSACNAHLRGFSEVNQKFHRLADLAEKGATLLDCGQSGVCATAPGCMRHWAERNRELVAERAAEDWQPIATAPTDGTTVLLWRTGDGVAIGHYDPQFCGNGQWWDGGNVLSGEPTLWRPLPAPPGGGR